MEKKAALKHEPHYKFKGFLIENHIHQKEIAEVLDISPVTVNQKINGSLHFSFDEVERLCLKYNIMPEIFLTKKLRNGNKTESLNLH